VNLLGIDTSTAASSAAVLRADGRAFEQVPPVERLEQRPGHARELLPAVEETMAAAGIGFGDLAAVAVGIGPGSFTGLRIGIATARALAHAHGLSTRPVSSLAALASGVEGRPALALIDARRGELFAGLYEDGRELRAPWVASPERVVESVQAHGRAPLAVGDGSLRFRGLLEAAGIEVAPMDSGLHVPRATWICAIGSLVAPEPPETVLPHYLRAPDAIPTSDR
jgi:tRNA threonylcarbamoyladenosine biosynthesis protein TsaB